jgi:DNA (cytosine-5)-methyltransferase 1
MNELHLFAGAGGGILGGLLLGHTPVCAVEIEPYCRKVLLQRQRDGILPVFPIWDDIKTFDGTPWRGRVDVVCGGFPCQDISSAGKGAGIEGERSGLWKEMDRVVREVGPDFVFVENSPMLTSRGLGTVLGDLAKLGYNARWGCISARAAGAPHMRNRMWILATHSNKVRLLQSFKKPKFLEKTIGVGSHWNGQFARVCDNNLSRWGWSHSSAFARVGDGVAHRNDRLKATGNGQVPSVVKLAWEILTTI